MSFQTCRLLGNYDELEPKDQELFDKKPFFKQPKTAKLSMGQKVGKKRPSISSVSSRNTSESDAADNQSNNVQKGMNTRSKNKSLLFNSQNRNKTNIRQNKVSSNSSIDSPSSSNEISYLKNEQKNIQNQNLTLIDKAPVIKFLNNEDPSQNITGENCSMLNNKFSKPFQNGSVYESDIPDSIMENNFNSELSKSLKNKEIMPDSDDSIPSSYSPVKCFPVGRKGGKLAYFKNENRAKILKLPPSNRNSSFHCDINRRSTLRNYKPQSLRKGETKSNSVCMNETKLSSKIHNKQKKNSTSARKNVFSSITDAATSDGNKMDNMLEHLQSFKSIMEKSYALKNNSSNPKAVRLFGAKKLPDDNYNKNFTKNQSVTIESNVRNSTVRRDPCDLIRVEDQSIETSEIDNQTCETNIDLDFLAVSDSDMCNYLQNELLSGELDSISSDVPFNNSYNVYEILYNEIEDVECTGLCGKEDRFAILLPDMSMVSEISDEIMKMPIDKTAVNFQNNFNNTAEEKIKILTENVSEPCNKYDSTLSENEVSDPIVKKKRKRNACIWESKKRRRHKKSIKNICKNEENQINGLSLVTIHKELSSINKQDENYNINVDNLSNIIDNSSPNIIHMDNSSPNIIHKDNPSSNIININNSSSNVTNVDKSAHSLNGGNLTSNDLKKIFPNSELGEISEHITDVFSVSTINVDTISNQNDPFVFSLQSDVIVPSYENCEQISECQHNTQFFEENIDEFDNLFPNLLPNKNINEGLFESMDDCMITDYQDSTELELSQNSDKNSLIENSSSKSNLNDGDVHELLTNDNNMEFSQNNLDEPESFLDAVSLPFQSSMQEFDENNVLSAETCNVLFQNKIEVSSDSNCLKESFDSNVPTTNIHINKDSNGKEQLSNFDSTCEDQLNMIFSNEKTSELIENINGSDDVENSNQSLNQQVLEVKSTETLSIMSSRSKTEAGGHEISNRRKNISIKEQNCEDLIQENRSSFDNVMPMDNEPKSFKRQASSLKEPGSGKDDITIAISNKDIDEGEITDNAIILREVNTVLPDLSSKKCDSIENHDDEELLENIEHMQKSEAIQCVNNNNNSNLIFSDKINSAETSETEKACQKLPNTDDISTDEFIISNKLQTKDTLQNDVLSIAHSPKHNSTGVLGTFHLSSPSKSKNKFDDFESNKINQSDKRFVTKNNEYEIMQKKCSNDSTGEFVITNSRPESVFSTNQNISCIDKANEENNFCTKKMSPIVNYETAKNFSSNINSSNIDNLSNARDFRRNDFNYLKHPEDTDCLILDYEESEIDVESVKDFPINENTEHIRFSKDLFNGFSRKQVNSSTETFIPSFESIIKASNYNYKGSSNHMFLGNEIRSNKKDELSDDSDLECETSFKRRTNNKNRILPRVDSCENIEDCHSFGGASNVPHERRDDDNSSDISEGQFSSISISENKINENVNSSSYFKRYSLDKPAYEKLEVLKNANERNIVNYDTEIAESQGSICHILELIKTNCAKRNINEALVIVKKYIPVSSDIIKRNIIKSFFLSIVEILKNPYSLVDIDTCERTLGVICDIMSEYNLYDEEVCSLIIQKGVELDIAYLFVENIFLISKKQGIVLRPEAISGYADLLRSTDSGIYKFLTYFEFMKFVCNSPIPKIDFHMVLDKCIKSENFFQIPITEEFRRISHLLCKLTKNEISGSYLRNFIKCCIKNELWHKITEFFRAWSKKTFFIKNLYQSFASPLEDSSSCYEKFAAAVFGNMEDEPPSHHVTLFGQIGVLLMLETFRHEHKRPALEILFILHKYQINYYELQTPPYYVNSCKTLDEKIEDPIEMFNFSHTVAFTAIDICLSFKRHKDAFEIFRSFKYLVPEDLRDTEIKFRIIKNRFTYLIKLCQPLIVADPFQRGLDVVRHLFDSAEKDFAITDLEKFRNDLKQIFNLCLTTFINKQQMDLLKEFYKYSHGSLKGILTFDSQVLRGLVVFYSQHNLSEDARELFKDGSTKGIYNIKKPEVQDSSWCLTIISCWTNCEIKLAIDMFVTMCFPLFLWRHSKSEEECFTLKINFQEEENYCTDIYCLDVSPTSVQATLKKTCAVLTELDPSIVWNEDSSENTLLVLADSFYNYWNKIKNPNETQKYTKIPVFIEKPNEISLGREIPSTSASTSSLSEYDNQSLISNNFIAPESSSTCSEPIVPGEQQVVKSINHILSTKMARISSDSSQRSCETSSRRNSSGSDMSRSTSPSLTKTSRSTLFPHGFSKNIVSNNDKSKKLSVPEMKSDVVQHLNNLRSLFNSSRKYQQADIMNHPSTSANGMNSESSSSEFLPNNTVALLPNKSSVSNLVVKPKKTNLSAGAGTKNSDILTNKLKGKTKVKQSLIGKNKLKVKKSSNMVNDSKKKSVIAKKKLVTKKKLIVPENDSIRIVINNDSRQVTSQDTPPKSVKADLKKAIPSKPSISLATSSLDNKPVIPERKQTFKPPVNPSRDYSTKNHEELEKVTHFLETKIIQKCKTLKSEEQHQKAIDLAKLFIQENNIMNKLDKKHMKLLFEFADKNI